MIEMENDISLKNNYIRTVYELYLVKNISVKKIELSYEFKNLLQYMLFYENNIPSNNHHANIQNNENFEMREGYFHDRIHFSNMRSVFQKIISLNKKKLETNDIVELKEAILKGTIGNPNEIRNQFSKNSFGDIRDNLRRYYIQVSKIYMAGKLNEKTDIKKMIAIINQIPKNKAETFVNAAKFHLDFEYMQPMTNANGRVGKLLTNLYLMKNGIRPMIIDSASKESYYESLNLFNISGYMGAFIGNMLVNCENKSEKQTYISLDNLNPYHIEMKYAVSLAAKTKYNGNLKKDIAILYDAGRSSDKNLTLAALWIAGSSRTYSEILIAAYSDLDKNIRSMSLWALANINPKKYKELIVNSAVNDIEDRNRIIAIGLLAENAMLDSLTVENILKVENNDLVLASLAETVQHISPSKKYLKSIEKLMKNRSVEVKMRGYGAFVSHASKKQIIELIKKIRKNETEIANEVIGIGYIRLFKKLNQDDIAIEMSNKAIKIVSSRQLFLRALSRVPNPTKISKNYVKFCEKVINLSNVSKKEIAYACYILSVNKGSDYLKKKYGFKIATNNDSLINFVLNSAEQYKNGH